MGEFILLIAWLMSVLIVGWGAVSLVFRNNSGLYAAERIALSYGIGIGLITVEMAVLSAIGVKVQMAYIISFAVLMMIPAIYFRSHDFMMRPSHARMSIGEKLLLGAILLQVFYAFFKAFIMPIEAYDAVAIYGMKAKIFYLSGGIPMDFFTRMGAFINHIEYPLLIPLAESSVYTFLGSLNDVASKVIFPFYYSAALVIFYSMVHRSSGRKPALLFTFLLATVPIFNDYASNGYADLPLAFYFSTSLFYIFMWTKGGRGAYLAISLLLSALAVWTKSEGIALLGVDIFIVLFCMLTSKSRSIAKQASLYIALSVILAILYLKLMSLLGININGDFKGARPDIMTAIKRIPAILYEYQIHFFGPKKWNIVWVLFIAAFLMGIKKVLSGVLRFPTIAIMLVFAGYTMVYMVTPQNFSWHLSTSASRLLIHFLPVVLLWLAIYCNEEKIGI